MKKIIKAGICVAAAAMIMTGCGNKNQNAESSSAAASAPTETETKSEEELHDEESVTLGDYKNLTFSAKEEEVTDAKIETRLKELCAEYPVTIEGRPAQEGDTANIDYSGTKDGEAFAGGTAEGYDLKLGSGTFIDGFDDSFVLYDDDRLKTALKWLAGAWDSQCIIFTCHQREEAILKSEGIEHHLIQIQTKQTCHLIVFPGR